MLSSGFTGRLVSYRPSVCDLSGAAMAESLVRCLVTPKLGIHGDGNGVISRTVLVH